MSGAIDRHPGATAGIGVAAGPGPADRLGVAARPGLTARPGLAANGMLTMPEAHRRLRAACDQLEAAFTQQLFSAMRDTLPGDDLAEASTADDIFTGMLDEHVAGLSAERTEGGLSEALYRQLARRLPTEEISE